MSWQKAGQPGKRSVEMTLRNCMYLCVRVGASHLFPGHFKHAGKVADPYSQVVGAVAPSPIQDLGVFVLRAFLVPVVLSAAAASKSFRKCGWSAMRNAWQYDGMSIALQNHVLEYSFKFWRKKRGTCNSIVLIEAGFFFFFLQQKWNKRNNFKG